MSDDHQKHIEKRLERILGCMKSGDNEDAKRHTIELLADLRGLNEEWHEV